MKNIERIKYALHVIQTCKNWREIIMAMIKKQSPKVILRNGFQIKGFGDNAVVDLVIEMYNKNVYTPPLFLPIEPTDTVVDIGANIGVFSLFAAYRTHDKVFAYEPFPDNFELLSQNIRVNNLHNISAYNMAVSDKVGSAQLFISKGSLGHHLSDHNITEELEHYVEVPTTTLQSIMDDNNLENIDFLKLDCEGSEGSILSSTPKDYLERVRKIAIEFHDNVSQLKHDEIQELLENFGFVVKLRWNGKSPLGYLYAKRLI